SQDFAHEPASAVPPVIASMTGYASAARESAAGSIAVELKTVNHRYLEFQTRMPEELRPLEPALREAVGARLSRGKVDCRITITPGAAAARAITPDMLAMQALSAASAKVVEAFPQARPLSVNEVLHWPGVLADANISPERLREEVMALIASAIHDLDQTRAREGAKLEAVLRERLESIATLVKEAQPLMPAAIRTIQEKLTARLAEAGASVADERLQQEVVLYAARIDVDEELSRLVTHVTEFRRVLDKGGAVGKRLDFLCQEFNREANTLGSKSVSNEITRISVELKVLIEQMREQVQNIE
ncbi:MAG TPA: YicC/YloC family endoribonuclease, partial [Usitatibacter sp.]|nr:YicC/YloC family endoribonuclease [Usitatibacter sp.]